MACLETLCGYAFVELTAEDPAKLLKLINGLQAAKLCERFGGRLGNRSLDFSLGFENCHDRMLDGISDVLALCEGGQSTSVQ